MLYLSVNSLWHDAGYVLDCLRAGSANFLKSMLADQKTTSSCLYPLFVAQG